MGKLEALETTWSLDDVARANALLDMRADMESEAMVKAKAGNK